VPSLLLLATVCMAPSRAGGAAGAILWWRGALRPVLLLLFQVALVLDGAAIGRGAGCGKHHQVRVLCNPSSML